MPRKDDDEVVAHPIDPLLAAAGRANEQIGAIEAGLIAEEAVQRPGALTRIGQIGDHRVVGLFPGLHPDLAVDGQRQRSREQVVVVQRGRDDLRQRCQQVLGLAQAPLHQGTVTMSAPARIAYRRGMP